jgi:hypothetical protein
MNFSFSINIKNLSIIKEQEKELKPILWLNKNIKIKCHDFFENYSVDNMFYYREIVCLNFCFSYNFDCWPIKLF